VLGVQRRAGLAAHTAKITSQFLKTDPSVAVIRGKPAKLSLCLSN
jgi:hypothetical protein